MAIDATSTVIKHVITEHNNWVTFTDGRGGFVAFMEGACGYSDWFNRIEHVRPQYQHVANCGKHPGCSECDAILPASQALSGRPS